MTPELRQVLWACHRCYATAPPNGSREICYRWIIDDYQRRFGVGFHQSRLQHLADLGYLHAGDLVRGGGRRYYALVDPPGVAALLGQWGLDQT
jgi:hypothetical protein